jgi:hypothetical protein
MRILVVEEEEDDDDDGKMEEALYSADDLGLDLLLLLLLLLPAVGGTHSPVDASDPEVVVESLLCSAIIIHWVRVVVAAWDDDSAGRPWKAKASTPPLEDAAAAKNPASAIRSFMVARCPY